MRGTAAKRFQSLRKSLSNNLSANNAPNSALSNDATIEATRGHNSAVEMVSHSMMQNGFEWLNTICQKVLLLGLRKIRLFHAVLLSKPKKHSYQACEFMLEEMEKDLLKE